jgi:hypothetical protein
VRGSAYTLGLEGHFTTHVLVEGSLYSPAVELQEDEQRRVVLSAYVPLGQAKLSQ